MPRGGRRPGAGRPRKAKKAAAGPPPNGQRRKAAPVVATGISDSKEYLEKVVRGDVKPTAIQLEAARALLPFQHRKLGETGKKEQLKDAAAKGSSRFSPLPRPALTLVQGGAPDGSNGRGGSDG